MATSSRLGDSGKGGTMGTRRIGPVGRLLVVAAVFVAVAVFAGQARAAFPGQTGRSRLSTQQWHPQMPFDPDGSHRDQLTHTSTEHHRSAAWSPNGREIVFDSDRTGAWQVYTMHADGSDIDKITHMRGFTGEPSWSPDGSRIVFAHSEAPHVVILSMSLPSACMVYTCTPRAGRCRRRFHADFRRPSGQNDWCFVNVCA